jgi:hypothetical protein
MVTVSITRYTLESDPLEVIADARRQSSPSEHICCISFVGSTRSIGARESRFEVTELALYEF